MLISAGEPWSAQYHFVMGCSNVTKTVKYVNMTDIISAQDLNSAETEHGLSEEDTVALIELLFFAYRDFVSDPDEILAQYGFGRAHHRVLHFVGRDPGMTVQQLLDILRITKQSLGRVLKELIDKGYVFQKEGEQDRRQRLLFLTEKGEELRQRLMSPQIGRIRRAVAQSGPGAPQVYRRVLYHMVSPENRDNVRDWIERAGLIGGQEGCPVDDIPHILVVDDDRRIRQLLQSYLLENGFRVTVAASAGEAREKMRGLVFDLAVLDIMMPGETGLDLTQSLRSGGNPIPVLMLSALADPSDRIAGLETGSDDYLSKPFEPRELLLRIQGLLRRNAGGGKARGEVLFGPYVFHLQRGELRKGAELIRLTTREKDFLRTLATRAGVPVPRAELAPEGSEEGARSVDVQINRLRQKIEADPSNPVHLQTVRGAGYVLHID